MSEQHNRTDQAFRLRKNIREMNNYPRPFIKIKSFDELSCCGGLIVDYNNDGLGIITSHPLPIGTKVAINLDDEYAAIGEVTDLVEDYYDWNWHGMSRMGIRFLDKKNWL